METLSSEPAGRQRDARQTGSPARSIYLLGYLPMSLMPSLMLIFAWTRYHDTAWSRVSLEAVLLLAAWLWFAELIVVPLLVQAVRLIGRRPDSRTEHHEIELMQAFAPPALMVTPLFLLVPQLFVVGAVLSAVSVAMMLFIGSYAIADPQGSDSPVGMSWLVVDLGFTAWAIIMLVVWLISFR